MARATRFEVPHTFILQQAAWLYERHLSHVRAQMKKVQSPATVAGTTSSNTTIGGVPMKRLGSGGSRGPSALSIRSNVDSLKNDHSMPGTPKAANAPALSRSPSTATVTQSKVQGQVPPTSPRPAHRSFRSAFPPSRKASPAVPTQIPASAPQPDSPASHSAAEMSSSSSSSDEEPNNLIRRSQIFKRPPRFTQRKTPLGPLEDASENDQDEDDSSNSDLPFANPDSTPFSALPPRANDPLSKPMSPAARTFDTRQAARSPPTDIRAHRQALGSISGIDSSASSASSVAPARHANIPSSSSPMSPRHRAELARLNHKRNTVSSPGSKGKGKETGSDGTPSMGSSFSDLDGESPPPFFVPLTSVCVRVT